ncbi:MAG: hypothetical protein ABEI96_00405 [Haloarculaceae archaeon]
MTTRTVERVDDWPARSFSGGYRELHDLADQEFSGVVETATAKLFMLNGTVVGVLGGTIEDFENAEGTAYEAPFPALPMLALMQERSDEVRAKYYTEDTPISEVDDTLSKGGFTGYVELSENVLSGDYYVIYHGGRSMSVAFVGESNRLVTGTEAFETADGEVGIYEVKPADVDVVDIPEPEPESDPDPGPTAGSGPTTETEEQPETDVTSSTPADETTTSASESLGSDSEATRSNDGATESDSEATGPDSQSTGSDSEATKSKSESTGSNAGADAGNEPAGNEGRATRATRSDRSDANPERDGTADAAGSETADPGEEARKRPGSRSAVEDGTTEQPTGNGGDSGGVASPSDDSREGTASSSRSTDPASSEADASDLEVRTVPSIDPDRSGSERDADSGPPAAGFGRAAGNDAGRNRNDPASTGGKTADSASRDVENRTSSRGGGGRSASVDQRHSENTAHTARDADGESADRTEAGATSAGATSAEPTASTDDDEPASADGTSGDDRWTDAETTELRENLRARQEEIEDLEAELESVEAERDDLADEREDLQARVDELTAERDELRAEVEDLESTVETLERKLDASGADLTGGDNVLTPQAALDGTNLFVRYESKGQPTLESAHDGGADAEAVARNLNLEYHTQFDADDTEVDGQPFEEYLHGTIQYRFVDWVINDLLYEIRDTGAEAGLQDLYDALPRIDRAELNGGVAVTYMESGETQHGEETFDVVLRDRMGDPLVVANLNDSRIAASETMMSSLVTATKRVRESKETLASGFLVTRSFFEPEALETAAEATGSGLLSRDKRRSFVKLSRKEGFHLCLAEARNDEFYLTVPEL